MAQDHAADRQALLAEAAYAQAPEVEALARDLWRASAPDDPRAFADLPAPEQSVWRYTAIRNAARIDASSPTP